MTLLPEVRRQLYTAVELQSKRRSILGIPLPATGRMVPRFRLGHLAIAASVLLVVVVVAVFLGVRGSRSGTSSPGATTIPASAVPAGTPAAARFVVARMAVFRRPQQAADRLPASVSEQLNGPSFGFSVIPSLTRLAATVHGGAVRIYVVVGRSGGYPVDVATALVVTRGPAHRYLITPPEVVAEEIAIPTGGLTPTAVAADNSYLSCTRTSCRSQPLPAGKGVTVAVVPDGVTRVKWLFDRFPPGPGTPLTVYPKVENNVALVTGLPGVGAAPHATWYGAHGQVIKPIPITRPPAPRRPVPAVVGRSFLALRGVPANHGVAIASHLGMRLSLVPHPAHLCVQFSRSSPIRRRGPIAPARHVVGGGDCVPISLALAGNFTTGLFGPNNETLIGVAPNGNRTVRLTLRDGSSRVVRVSQNVYIAKTSKHFTSVTLKDANGALRTWRTP